MTPSNTPLYAVAEVEQSSPSSAPLLSAGHLTVKVLHLFDTACQHYFSVKDIAANDQVGKIIYNFKSTAIQSWINVEEACLITLSFPDFLVALKRKFLPHSWEDELVQDADFLTWVNNDWNANDELGTAQSNYHIPSECFHLHLIS